jgi:chemotaxis signal transduction protein
MIGETRPEVALLIEGIDSARFIDTAALGAPPQGLREDTSRWLLGVTDDGALILDTTALLASRVLTLRAD